MRPTQPHLGTGCSNGSTWSPGLWRDRCCICQRGLKRNDSRLGRNTSFAFSAHFNLIDPVGHNFSDLEMGPTHTCLPSVPHFSSCLAQRRRLSITGLTWLSKVGGRPSLYLRPMSFSLYLSDLQWQHSNPAIPPSRMHVYWTSNRTSTMAKLLSP